MLPSNIRISSPALNDLPVAVGSTQSVSRLHMMLVITPSCPLRNLSNPIRLSTAFRF